MINEIEASLNKSVLKLAFNTDATLFCLFFTKAAAIHFKLKQYENKRVFSLLVVFCKACQQHEMSTNKKIKFDEEEKQLYRSLC